jgi:hypothetical protein
MGDISYSRIRLHSSDYKFASYSVEGEQALDRRTDAIEMIRSFNQDKTTDDTEPAHLMTEVGKTGSSFRSGCHKKPVNLH